MRGKLRKTGSKETMKEQNKARKASSNRRFVVKKAKERKEQAQKKLERLGLAPEKKEVTVPPRPRRFILIKSKEKKNRQVNDSQSHVTSPEPSVDDLVSEFTESH